MLLLFLRMEAGFFFSRESASRLLPSSSNLTAFPRKESSSQSVAGDWLQR